MRSEYLLVRTEQASAFSPNTEKYGPEKTTYMGNFRAVTTSIPVTLT